LALATLLCIAILFVVAARLFPGAPMGLEGGAVAGQLGFATILFVSIVNPVFEEFFVNAYLITSLTKQGGRLATALAVGIAIRLLYHSYLGAVVAPLVLIAMEGTGASSVVEP
jgi:membrane protease YdiL (CAAX protease family)